MDSPAAKNRLFILTAQPNPTETFLDRDIAQQFNDYHDKTIIYLNSVIKKQPFFSRLFPSLLHKLAARTIIRNHSIGKRDTILAYWANYVLDVAFNISKIAQAKLQVSCHANDVFCRSYLAKIDPLYIDRYYFCCKKTMEWAIENYALRKGKVEYAAHNLPKLPEWAKPVVKHFNIVNIARNSPKKNLKGVLSCLCYLEPYFSNMTFTQIGLHDLKGFILPEGNFRIDVKESMPFEEICDKMLNSHLMIYGSCIAKDGDRDGLPNVLREAGAMGLPVVYERGWANDEIEYKGPSLAVNCLRKEKEKILEWILRLYPEFEKK
ncbi:MAG: hypothetical protein GF401_09520 [Chitinivibrionales bacterium]|nr:hypothetical protein [Chitinivibrionales bacterium]